jgi:hypothetical protein
VFFTIVNLLSQYHYLILEHELHPKRNLIHVCYLRAIYLLSENEEVTCLTQMNSNLFVIIFSQFSKLDQDLIQRLDWEHIV